MRLHPVYPVLLAPLLLFAAFVLDFSYVALLGFPDGATTEYDVAMSNVMWTFDRFTVAVAIWLVALGWLSRKRNMTRPFLVTVAAYVAAIFVVHALDRYFAATLPGPWGG